MYSEISKVLADLASVLARPQQLPRLAHIEISLSLRYTPPRWGRDEPTRFRSTKGYEALRNPAEARQITVNLCALFPFCSVLC